MKVVLVAASKNPGYFIPKPYDCASDKKKRESLRKEVSDLKMDIDDQYEVVTNLYMGDKYNSTYKERLQSAKEKYKEIKDAYNKKRKEYDAAVLKLRYKNYDYQREVRKKEEEIRRVEEEEIRRVEEEEIRRVEEEKRRLEEEELLKNEQHFSRTTSSRIETKMKLWKKNVQRRAPKIIPRIWKSIIAELSTFHFS